MAVAFNLVWRYAVHAELTVPGLHADVFRTVNRNYLIGPPCYAASGALAFVSSYLALAVVVGLALLFLPGMPGPRRADEVVPRARVPVGEP